MAFTTVTVTRDYDLADGTDPTGTVTFTPTTPMVNGVTVVAAPVTARLDVDGVLSIELAANTDPATLPSANGYYLVKEVIGGVTRSYYVQIPHNAGSTIDLATLDTIVSVTPPDSVTLATLLAAKQPLLSRVILPQTYGAVSDGATDSAAAFQSAVTAAETLAANGGPATVYIDGTFKLNNASNAAINLSRNNSGSRGWVNIIGAPGAKIILTANTSRFLNLNRVADYDTFQKIRVENLEIDAGNTAGSGGVIIGNVATGGAQAQRLNFADIVVRNVKATNLYEEASTATSQRMGIMLIGNHPGALEATQTSCTNVLVEDVAVYGGAGGANVCSYGAALVGGVNHYHNNIRFHRVRHEISTLPATSGSQTSWFITGCGFGDYCEIIDAYSKNSSDDAIEIGAMQTVVLERIRIENPFLYGVFIRNFHALTDVTTAVATISDATVSVSSAAVAAASHGGTRHVAFGIGSENTYGAIRLVRPQVYLDGSGATHSAPTDSSQFVGVNGQSVRHLQIESPRVVYANYAFDKVGSTQEFNLIYFKSVATNARLLVRDMVARLDSPTVTTTQNVFASLIRMEGTGDLDLDGFELIASAFTLSGGGSFRMVDLGRQSGASVSARIRRLRPRTGSIGGVSVNGVVANSTTTLTAVGEIQISDCEFSGMANVSAEISIDSTQAGKVRVSGLGLRTGQPGAASVTPSASPYTYLNSAAYNKQITVAGGTVSLIELQGVTGSFFTTGLTAGTFQVRQGGRVRITYTVAPTVIEVPQN